LPRALVFIGGRGAGKSFLIKRFIKALLLHLSGLADAKTFGGDFPIAPFLNRLLIGIDEAKFTPDMFETVKDLMNNATVAGQKKYIDPTEYTLTSRIIIVSNRYDLRFNNDGALERAPFYIRATDPHLANASDVEVEQWQLKLARFYGKFDRLLNKRDACEHFVAYLMNYRWNKMELMSARYSSKR
jgi:hypothetical protein